MNINSQPPSQEFEDGRNQGYGSAEAEREAEKNDNKRQVGEACLALTADESAGDSPSESTEAAAAGGDPEAQEYLQLWQRLLAQPELLEEFVARGLLSEELKLSILRSRPQAKQLVLTLMDTAETDTLLREALLIHPSAEAALLAANRARTEELRSEIAEAYAEIPAVGCELVMRSTTEKLKERIWSVNKDKRVASAMARTTGRKEVLKEIIAEFKDDVEVLLDVANHTESEELLLQILRGSPPSKELAVAVAGRAVSVTVHRTISELYEDRYEVLLKLAQVVDDAQLRTEILNRLPEILEDHIKRETKTVVVTREPKSKEPTTFSGPGSNALHRFDCSYA